MTDNGELRHLDVARDGQVLAQATMSGPDDAGEACAQVHMAPGHLPVGTRQQMVDAVLDAVNDTHADRLTAAVPRGDVELMEGLCEHLHDVKLRAAGATSIIEGELTPG
jgi:acyl-CoA reductase-like NAD-dependent aldehyde dehydrogenase